MSTPQAFKLVGVIHLLPLPAAPRTSPGLRAVSDRALFDAEVLALGGLGGCILENLGDAPFRATGVDPHVIAMMAVIADRIRARFGSALSLGVNVLRNDAPAALGVAAACGADFVRVNVHVGATWTDQGLITGAAHETLRYRRELGLAPDGAGGGVAIFADVMVKHGVPAGQTDLAAVARETAERGGADGLIVTGIGTGAPTALADVRVVREAAPGHPVWVGSGLTLHSLAETRAVADGAIVGTWLHRDGCLEAPLDLERVRRLVGESA